MTDNLKIILGNKEDFKFIYEKMRNDFAEEELKEYNQILKLMDKEKYKLFLLRDNLLNVNVGYALILEIDSQKIFWLDYIAIDKDFRDFGYGTKFIKTLVETYKENLNGIIFEVEIPDDKNEEEYKIQLKRIQFYERLGARKLSINYKFPSENGGFPMYLYFIPINQKSLLKSQIKDIILTTFNYIHSDVDFYKEIFELFEKSIQDEFFS